MRVRIVGEWKAIENALSPEEFEARINHFLPLAHERMGRRFVRDARRLIRSGAYAPNSPLTVLLKGSSKPLVDKGDLFQSITFENTRWPGRRFVISTALGVIKRKAGPRAVNIAQVLHDGATIDTRRNPAIRRAVFAKARDALAKAGRSKSASARARRAAARALGVRAPLTRRQRAAMFARMGGRARAGSGVWVIPGRPFITRPFSDAAFQIFVRDTWEKAIRRAVFRR